MDIENEFEIHKKDNEEYVKLSELENYLLDKRIITKNQFMRAVERNLGYCTAEQRPHTFIDYEMGKKQDSDTYYCNNCGMDIDYGKFESGQQLEMFVFGKSWLVIREQREKAPENID